uniref:Uncharacterized protein n=1 Tax=Tanacetum cinerariifolium TaxID=118510 RepID=A0A699GRN3_TANCI|nr:hypothetical protein [Tanacetum cinerariifolium]
MPLEDTFGCKFFLERGTSPSTGASTTLIYSPGSSSTTIYSPGSSTPLRYSPRASTPQCYSLGTSRNAEFSNWKHLLDKITVLEAMVDMYMHMEQHIVNSAALFHEVYIRICVAKNIRGWSLMIYAGEHYDGSDGYDYPPSGYRLEGDGDEGDYDYAPAASKVDGDDDDGDYD